LVTGATSKLGHVGVELCRSQDLYRGKVIATTNVTQNGHVLFLLCNAKSTDWVVRIGTNPSDILRRFDHVDCAISNSQREQ